LKKNFLSYYRKPIRGERIGPDDFAGEAASESDLAREMGIYRVWVNHFISLQKLDTAIIQSIEKMGDQKNIFCIIIKKILTNTIS